MQFRNTELRFSGLAGNYAAARPSYAEALIEDLYTAYGFSPASIIADVGSGTGKFAEQLLRRGCTAWCVEPNDDMRAQAVKSLYAFPNGRVVKGSDRDTGLPSASVDFVTAAQAFHWFDRVAFAAECRRILKPQGRVLLVWNFRDAGAPLHVQLAEIYRQFCPQFCGFTMGFQEDDAALGEFFTGGFRKLAYKNPLQYTREQFVTRGLSNSYALRPAAAEYPTLREALGRLFDCYAVNGSLEAPNRTVGYLGSLD